jgi:hypothetical protein
MDEGKARGRRAIGALLAACTLVAGVGLIQVVTSAGEAAQLSAAAPGTVVPDPRTERVARRAAPVQVTTTTTTTTAPPPKPTTTTTVAPTTTTTAPPAHRFTQEPNRGLGAWLDVYDWSATYAQHAPALEPDAVDALAAQGVQTLFIQASKWDAPEDVLEAPRLLAFIDRAHQRGVSVVGWYLPTFEDPGRDLQRMLAIAALPVDGLAVDIESRKVGDVAERNRRVVELSSAQRAALPGEVLGAIPLEPILIEDINPRYWPDFPWAGIAPSYDVWMPMAYWTNRRADSPWRNAHDYTAANIDRVRAHVGRPDAPVHALGGIGDATSVQDLQAFRAAAMPRGVLGGSIYDFRTTAAPFWPELLPFRDLRG